MRMVMTRLLIGTGDEYREEEIKGGGGRTRKLREVVITYVPTAEQQANILTKALDPTMFKAARAMLGMGAL